MEVEVSTQARSAREDGGLGGPWNRRLAAYSYLRPLVSGARVLEIGCGAGGGTRHVASLGAAAVVGLDSDARALEAARQASQAGAGADSANVTFHAGINATVEAAGPFDLVLVPDAVRFLKASEMTMASVTRLLAPGGRLVCLARSADAPGPSGGIGYFDLADALGLHFGKVRMFGVTPFVAFGLAEFEEAVSGVRLESALVDADGAGETPTDYLAIAGREDDADDVDFGYALVQIPLPPVLTEGAGGSNAGASTSSEVAMLRRKLLDVEGQADGVLRVSRAQAEEIEELRARLRRGTEEREALDAEVTRLRRGLADADESVLTLTRRTTEEMTALAHQLTSGLRGIPAGGHPHAGADGRAMSALAEELRKREVELAARESALFERDERIAALEAEKQDLLWRLQAAEDRARRAGAEARVAPAALRQAAASEGGDVAWLEATLRLREQAIEQFRVGAAAHKAEVTQLKAALGEQSTLVTELEESVAAAETRLASLDAEVQRLRAAAAQGEESDRGRRARLAELEGTLLRLRRQDEDQTVERLRSAEQQAALRDAEQKVAGLSAQVAELEKAAGENGRRREDAERRWGDAVGRIVGQVVTGGDLGASDGTYQAIIARISSELAELESGLRAEVGNLAEVERALADVTARIEPPPSVEDVQAAAVSDIER